MIITGDYHTHTRYSRFRHGKNTIKQMVEKAEDLGLVSYGFSDHGPKHILYRMNPRKLDKIRKEVDEINKTSKLRVLFGCEANLIKKDGSIDMTEDQIKKLDYLVVGYHICAFNNFYCPFRNKEKQKEINTQAYINCLNKYKVKFISHLNEHVKVDVYKVACEAKKHGTAIELNNKHLRFNQEDAKQLIESGCDFILSSDAHHKDRIAKFDNVLDFVEKYNIPKERILNIDKVFM